MTLTSYTIHDINLIRTLKSDHEVIEFKKNLIVELRENYKLIWSKIAYLLNGNEENTMEMYYNFKEHDR